ncbi:hypothetical protein NDU88_004754 [Pleurodeles waltl]|uniref:Uncharacterized protein n=1 Tax=Pleurodeles waltl TaxID=8319 RepID=A0AAV7QFP9_PLEWA|nr:hypothetical protein NDU88_004754 [Pleurodeles waltl]
MRASERRREEEESKEDHRESGQEEKEDCGKCLKNSDEPSESKDQHCRTSTLQVAHVTSRIFSEAGTGGRGFGNTENPATLWGERGLGKYGPAVDGSNVEAVRGGRQIYRLHTEHYL